MKERVIILAEGGVCGHFILTLLQTMHVPEWFNNVKVPDDGCMDSIAEAGSLVTNYLLNKKQCVIYPERIEAMDLIIDAFKNPESTYKPYQSEYEKQFHEVHLLHYQWQRHVLRFLYLSNTKIIFIRYDANDYKRIAVNKITKNFSKETAVTSAPTWEIPRKEGYAGLLNWVGLSNSDLIDELYSLTDLDHASKSLTDALIHAWEIYCDQRSVHCNPTPHKNMLILNFNDIYFNKEIIMESLSKFSGLPINDTTRSIYDNYLAKQPNIDLY